MKKLFPIFGYSFICIAIIIVFGSGGLVAQTETNTAMGWGDGFVKTNGQYVTIGDAIYETNSLANTDEYKHFMWRAYELLKIANSGSSNAMDELAEGAWRFIKDYPNRANGYEDIMWAIDGYESDGKPVKSRALADELAASSAPEKYKLWAHGFLNRLDSRGKPISLQFKAADGRKVDLAKMNGRVVLVDFWATDCGPCVAELPRIKTAYDKYHGRGFEVIGISCDTDKEKLERFVKQHDISWPQYFDGKQQDDNKFTLAFGIDGIPHMFLVDKKGFLHFDNVRAGNKFHPKGDITSFEDKIESLLAE